jgi:2-dehydropantoate 2-reductase
MRICIFGAGSLGSALGGMLADKNEVVLIGRKEHVNAVQKDGLRMLGDRAGTVHLNARETVNGLASPELLIISTKAYDTKEAIGILRRWVDDDTMVLTLQNGLGNLEQIRSWKEEKAFGGTTTMGAALISPGTVRLSGLGKTIIGSDEDPRGASRIVSAFTSCGLPARTSRDMIGVIWTKAMVNACINPTAAVLRVPNGKLTESGVVARFMRDVGRECELVAAASGINSAHVDVYRRVRAVCKGTAENTSSMLQDVQNGRRTEIDEINGAFCSLGDKVGVPTPLNDALVAMIQSLASQKSSEKG